MLPLKISKLPILILFLFSTITHAAPAAKASDDEIADLIIKQSVATYSGSCACPYSTARNGSRCGKRSAYSKPGGAAPLCYREDVSPEQINAWRKRNK